MMTRLRRPPVAGSFLVALPLILGSLAGCEPAGTKPAATKDRATKDATTKTADAPVIESLRGAAEFIQKQKSFRVTVGVEMQLEFQGRRARDEERLFVVG